MNIDLDKQIRDVIARSGVSQYRLAVESGVSNAAICRFLNHNQSLTLRTAGKLLAALNVSVELKPNKGR